MSESKQSLSSKEGFEETDSVVSVIEKVASDLRARLETDSTTEFEAEPTDLNDLQENATVQEDEGNDSMVELRRPPGSVPADRSIQNDTDDEEKFRKRLSSIVKPSPDMGNSYKTFLRFEIFQLKIVEFFQNVITFNVFRICKAG